MNAKKISIASGKGGVGKTITTVQLAVSARQQNKKVLILDGDLGMANVDVVLGLRPRYNINDVIDGGIELQDIILQGPMGIHLIPTGSGLTALANLPLSHRICLLDQLDEISNEYDIVFIDSGAGIGETVMHLNSVSDEVIVVTTPEPHAMTDAYAFIKVLSENYKDRRVNLLVNQAVNKEHGLKIAKRITDVVDRFLDQRVSVIGVVPFDDIVGRTVMNQTVGSDVTAHSRSGQAWSEISRKILENKNGLSQSWNALALPNDICVHRI